MSMLPNILRYCGLLFAGSALLFASCKGNVSAENYCAHFVKLAKVEMRDVTETELQQACKQTIAELKSTLSKKEFQDYARCSLEKDRLIDLDDCNRVVKVEAEEDETTDRQKRDQEILLQCATSADPLCGL